MLAAFVRNVGAAFTEIVKVIATGHKLTVWIAAHIATGSHGASPTSRPATVEVNVKPPIFAGWKVENQTMSGGGKMHGKATMLKSGSTYHRELLAVLI
jgi:hypothetical protein